MVVISGMLEVRAVNKVWRWSKLDLSVSPSLRNSPEQERETAPLANNKKDKENSKDHTSSNHSSLKP